LTGGGFIIGVFLVWWLVVCLPSFRLDYRLIAAARQNNTNSIHELVHGGVDVNTPVGPKKRTALMVAAANGSVEAVRVLLELGADPKLKDADGLTAVELAVAKSQHRAAAEIQLFMEKLKLH